MHDTAFQIGSLAMNIYADLQTASVLEVGSQSFNGSLRENAFPSTKYTGLDIEPGDGVDVVAEPGKPLPFEAGSFDLVLASSVFEHDPCFWMTFLEMCRATKDGGYIYVNAPSNGFVHRFPQDNWRFYPDSGRALAKWAASQGQAVTLVESFIADREHDVWNDFVAVFRKGRITKTLPKVFLHEHFPSSNVITWKSKEVVNPRDSTQDMLLLNDAHQRAETASKELELVVAERDLLRGELTEADKVRGELGLRESELRQRQEEIEQTRSELSRVRDKKEALERELSDAQNELTRARGQTSAIGGELEAAQAELTRVRRSSREEIERLTSQRSELQRQIEATKSDLDLLNSRLAKAQSERSASESAAKAAEGKLAERYQEIATLTHLLHQQERSAEEIQQHLDWIVMVHSRKANQPAWWSVMPKRWRLQRERQSLKRSGLFDGDAYLQRYPDVAAAGLDPLDHYLRHGIHEDRVRRF